MRDWDWYRVEAQLAGLLSIVSDVVPAEADILPTQVFRLPLAKPATAWARGIAGMHSSRESSVGM